MKQENTFYPASSTQARVIKIMGRILGHGRLAHAYTLTGPEDTGKEALAFYLARIFLCEAPEIGDVPRPCGKCQSCIKTGHGLHPDLFILRPDGALIKVDQIRKLQQAISFAPLEAKRRVSILVNAHRMNQEAANALLKTLEEPPSQNHLILTATSADGLLPTLVSRCQLIRCDVLSQAQLKGLIKKELTCPDEAIGFLSCLAEGGIAKTKRLLDMGVMGIKNEILDLLMRKGPEGVPMLFNLSKKLSQETETTLLTIQVLRSITRDLTLIIEAKRLVTDSFASCLINQDRLKTLYALADAVTGDKLEGYSQFLDRAEWMLERNINQELILEAALVFWIRKNQ